MDLNFEATELRLGLSDALSPEKRSSSELGSSISDENDTSRSAPLAKAQVVGVAAGEILPEKYRKKSEFETGCGIFVKVSMDGAPYLRKVDLKMYKSYEELMNGLHMMFKGLYSEKELEYKATYEDKDRYWMLVGDMPWDMFLISCTRLRIMKTSQHMDP